MATVLRYSERLDRLAQVVREADPDVIAFQADTFHLPLFLVMNESVFILLFLRTSSFYDSFSCQEVRHDDKFGPPEGASVPIGRRRATHTFLLFRPFSCRPFPSRPLLRCAVSFTSYPLSLSSQRLESSAPPRRSASGLPVSAPDTSLPHSIFTPSFSPKCSPPLPASHVLRAVPALRYAYQPAMLYYSVPNGEVSQYGGVREEEGHAIFSKVLPPKSEAFREMFQTHLHFEHKLCHSHLMH